MERALGVREMPLAPACTAGKESRWACVVWEGRDVCHGTFCDERDGEATSARSRFAGDGLSSPNVDKFDRVRLFISGAESSGSG